MPVLHQIFPNKDGNFEWRAEFSLHILNPMYISEDYNDEFKVGDTTPGAIEWQNSMAKVRLIFIALAVIALFLKVLINFIDISL